MGVLFLNEPLIAMYFNKQISVTFLNYDMIILMI